MCGLLQGATVRAIAVVILALWGAGCAVPASARRSEPRVEFATPHPEPELVATSESTPTAPAPAPVTVTHTLESGQTLYRVALKYGVSVDELMRENGITDPTTLAVGRVLKIPQVAGSKPLAPAGAQEATVAQSNAPSPSPAPTPRPQPKGAVRMPTGEGVLEWPLRGVLYARFGKKGSERHDGIDLAAPKGTPVKTAKAGKVLYAGEQKGYGLIAIVDHGDGLITLYAHNDSLRVKSGQKVRDGQVLATVGESGRTSGPQLHFEVRKDGVPVDPLKFLGAPPGRTAHGRRSSEGR